VPAVSRLSFLILSPYTHPICHTIDGHLAGAGSEQAILPAGAQAMQAIQVRIQYISG
jgi:hypothetical protein